MIVCCILLGVGYNNEFHERQYPQAQFAIEVSNVGHAVMIPAKTPTRRDPLDVPRYSTTHPYSQSSPPPPTSPPPQKQQCLNPQTFPSPSTSSAFLRRLHPPRSKSRFPARSKQSQSTPGRPPRSPPTMTARKAREKSPLARILLRPRRHHRCTPADAGLRPRSAAPPREFLWGQIGRNVASAQRLRMRLRGG
jgi:hypothetical protein